MARVAANPRVPAAVLERDSPRLLDDGGLCQGHNHLDERGFEVFRGDVGTSKVIDPDRNGVT